jgi:hypothetical protein
MTARSRERGEERGTANTPRTLSSIAIACPQTTNQNIIARKGEVVTNSGGWQDGGRGGRGGREGRGQHEEKKEEEGGAGAFHS